VLDAVRLGPHDDEAQVSAFWTSVPHTVRYWLRVAKDNNVNAIIHPALTLARQP
jgi:hypothetical protein